jgi:hypothetical protein
VSAESIAAEKDYLARGLGLGAAAAEQLADYLAAAKGVLGVLPTQATLVFERFFDETGGQQLVIHAPYGSRVNRAWGLALRKRFCRQFNFELQAAATEDAIILSLGETHSFELAEVARYLNRATVRALLVQALLAAPMFGARWRWVANIALAVRRFRGGKKNPPPLQRIQAEDLMAVVFPDGLACFENLQGEREVPRRPWSRATCRTPRRSRTRSWRRAPTPFSTTRRSRSAAPRRSWRGAGSTRSRHATSASSILKRSHACAPRPGRRPRPPTSCTTRSCCSAPSPRTRARRTAGPACSRS